MIGPAAGGGGVWADGGDVTLINSTVADNEVPAGGAGGGLNVIAATVTLDNSIVALNTGDATASDFAGTVSSASAYNLIGTGGSGGLVNGVNHNQVGVADPGLDPNGLQDNGGPTRTIALVAGSPAIDAGSNALAVDPSTGLPLTTDQRGTGFVRIYNSVVDIGAFEVQPHLAVVVTEQPPSSVAAGSPFGLSVAVEDASGNVDTSFIGSFTVALANSPGGSILGGTLTLTAHAGVADFTGLTLNEPGAGDTLSLTASGLVPTTTNEFNVQTTVAAVSVGWGIETAPLFTASDGLRLLPAGRKTDLPWLGIDQLPITLAQATTLVSGDITVLSAIRVNYGRVTVSGSGTSYIIKLAQPIEQADRVTISIGNATIANFTRRLDVLPGDFTDNGVVNAPDAVDVRNEWLRLFGAVPTIYGDINGDGVVNATDYVEVFERIPTRLPSLAGASIAPATIGQAAPEPVRIGAPSPSQPVAASRTRPRAEIRLSGRGWSQGTLPRGKIVNQRLVHPW
jgi:hypothetical protein